MNLQTFPPIMHSPQLMSAQQLQPSPFAPDQFLTRPTHFPASSESNAACSQEDAFPAHSFIKKRPLEVTEDLIEGRVETLSQRLRRCKSSGALARGISEPLHLGFAAAMESVEPTTPPNRPQSPISLAPRDITLSRDVEHLRHSSQMRRKPNSRRSTKIRRSCAGTPSRKPSTQDSPLARATTRSPLGRWTPPTLSIFQPFSADSHDLPTTPPPRPASACPFSSSDHSWISRIPWTITSPSSSPYPSSPLINSEHQA